MPLPGGRYGSRVSDSSCRRVSGPYAPRSSERMPRAHW